MKHGFTLIEVVVVVGVIAIIAAVTLASFPEFSERIGIEQEAGKFALSLRKAQTYALAVRELQQGSGIFPPYGVNVAMGDLIHYTIFGDVNFEKNNPSYSPRFESFLGESVEVFSVEKRVSIFQICGNSQSVPLGSCCL